MRRCSIAVAAALVSFNAFASEGITCAAVDEKTIAGLFDRWNDTLRTGTPAQIAALYADDAILLPTLSNTPRYTTAQRVDYFNHFQAKRPRGHIDEHVVFLGCNVAVDAGVYTFTFDKEGGRVQARYTFTYAHDGERWRITSHHSSAMPEPVESMP